MECNRNAFVDGAFEPGKIGDGSLEDLVAEGLADLGQIGELKCAGSLELGDDVAQVLQPGIIVPLYPLDDGPDAGRATGAPVGRFQGNDDEIRCAEGGVAGQGHPRRTVQEDIVVVRQKSSDGVGKGGLEPLGFPLARLRKVQPGKMAGHGNHVDMRVRGLPDEIAGFGTVVRIEQPLDAGGLVVVRQEALGDIGLLVEIYDQAAVTTFLADGGDKPADVRLANASLEIERRDDVSLTRIRLRHAAEFTAAPA